MRGTGAAPAPRLGGFQKFCPGSPDRGRPVAPGGIQNAIAMSAIGQTFDCIIVGAGFGGLACASALSDRGFHTRILERKADAGEKLRTTGIIVRDAVDDIALLDGLPAEQVRRIPAVRLYTPSMRSIRLDSDGYYFLASDTPRLMRWLATLATRSGAEIAYRSTFGAAERVSGGWDLGSQGRCRFLVGADGARSVVARALNLGCNRRLLHGIEYEYTLGPQGPQLEEADALHCFVDRRLAPGYIAWMLQGVKTLQVGLARRGEAQSSDVKTAMREFLARISPLVQLDDRKPDSVRAGPIPCGGLVKPHARSRALLVGDAAGMVSPVTAGGIHTALRYGLAAGHAVADFLQGRGVDPAGELIRHYPRFRAKRLLRFAYDHLQCDWAFNALLTTPVLRRMASRLYFHR